MPASSLKPKVFCGTALKWLQLFGSREWLAALGQMRA